MSAALDFHKQHKGKLEIQSKTPLSTQEDLALAYTPGVAEPCLAIADDTEKSYEYTARGNMVLVISDGTAVLGLGDIGPEAAMPVMEGKAILFKEFAGVDAFPLCVDTKNIDEIVQLVRWLQPSFGGVNLEDISAPRCFEIEERLKQELSIPVFHDDQHGTAIVTLAGMINAAKVVWKEMKDLSVVISGAGAAGIAVCKLLHSYGIQDFVLCDSRGAIYQGRDNLNPIKEEMAQITNQQNKKGALSDVIQWADVFIGVSQPGVLTQDMVRSMASDPIIFAMANPTPEIMPQDAHAAGAAVIATGRSDFPNQINNVLAFPGLFRGVLDARLPQITEEIKVLTAEILASCIETPTADCIIPSAMDKTVAPKIAQAIQNI